MSRIINFRTSSIVTNQLNQGILIIFLGLILLNGIFAIPNINSFRLKKLMNANPQNLNQNEMKQLSSSFDNQNKIMPNFYYFIFDEYGGYDNLLRYCNFDNSEFYNNLEQFGFITSKNSINSTIDTFTEIPNLLQLKIVNSVDMPGDLKKVNFKDPYLLTLMKENGYSINALDSSNYEFIDPANVDTKLEGTYVSTYGTFKSYIINNSIIYPFYGKNEHTKEIKKIKMMFDYAKTASKEAETNLFTIGYFSFPHNPYIVDENGNKTNDKDRLNLRDPNIYLDQLKFSNKLIIDLVQEIIKNNPDSIIILQSDHGYRLPSHLQFWYGLNEYDLDEESPYQRNILNAVYYKGQNIEIEGLNGLNTLLKVLGELLDQS